MHVVIHGRHDTHQWNVCVRTGDPQKVNCQNKWGKKILSYRIIRIKHIFSGVY